MRSVAKPFIILVERFYPDPFVFAIVLTFGGGMPPGRLRIGEILAVALPSPEAYVLWGLMLTTH